jgi:membrane-bound metal-dependent hydrolase YbcI (DUF457 family)
MPTPVGHSLAGIAVALAGERGPRARDVRRFLARPTTVLCVALATLPDADLLFPGFHRTATHSVTATVVVALVAVAMTARGSRGTSGSGEALRRIAWSAVVMYGAAHASHLLLDWLNCDSSPQPGIQALWPFDHRWFSSGWCVFPGEERRHIFTRCGCALVAPTKASRMNRLEKHVPGALYFHPGANRRAPVSIEPEREMSPEPACDPRGCRSHAVDAEHD